MDRGLVGFEDVLSGEGRAKVEPGTLGGNLVVAVDLVDGDGASVFSFLDDVGGGGLETDLEVDL